MNFSRVSFAVFVKLEGLKRSFSLVHGLEAMLDLTAILMS